MSRIDESREFIPCRIAVLTVSDTRTPEEDRSGDVLVERLTEAGHLLADRTIVPDDREGPPAWRYAGRWWARPVAARRQRPWVG